MTSALIHEGVCRAIGNAVNRRPTSRTRARAHDLPATNQRLHSHAGRVAQITKERAHGTPPWFNGSPHHKGLA